jgi:multisubunit Na+/H+ antiporter MnhG subunit
LTGQAVGVLKKLHTGEWVMKDQQNILTIEKCKDAGLALVLLGLIGYQAWPRPLVMLLTIICLLVVMTCPVVFRPFARGWFALSNLLGAIVSRCLLTVLFLVLVVPVGRIRRALGNDAMQKKRWNKDKTSVFRSRDHEFTAQDLEHPY